MHVDPKNPASDWTGGVSRHDSPHCSLAPGCPQPAPIHGRILAMRPFRRWSALQLAFPCLPMHLAACGFRSRAVLMSSPRPATANVPPSNCACDCPPPECNCPACQAKKAADLKKAVAGAYANPFYNNNFAYLNNPAYDDWHIGEHFKQVPIGDCWMLDLGGQYRARYMDERNFRGLHLTGRRRRLSAASHAAVRQCQVQRLVSLLRRIHRRRKQQRILRAAVDRSEPLGHAQPVCRRASSSTATAATCGSASAGRNCSTAPSDSFRRSIGRTSAARSKASSSIWQGQDWNVDVFVTRPVLA